MHNARSQAKQSTDNLQIGGGSSRIARVVVGSGSSKRLKREERKNGCTTWRKLQWAPRSGELWGFLYEHIYYGLMGVIFYSILYGMYRAEYL